MYFAQVVMTCDAKDPDLFCEWSSRFLISLVIRFFLSLLQDAVNGVVKTGLYLTGERNKDFEQTVFKVFYSCKKGSANPEQTGGRKFFPNLGTLRIQPWLKRQKHKFNSDSICIIINSQWEKASGCFWETQTYQITIQSKWERKRRYLHWSDIIRVRGVREAWWREWSKVWNREQIVGVLCLFLTKGLLTCYSFRNRTIGSVVIGDERTTKVTEHAINTTLLSGLHI